MYVFLKHIRSTPLIMVPTLSYIQAQQIQFPEFLFKYILAQNELGEW